MTKDKEWRQLRFDIQVASLYFSRRAAYFSKWVFIGKVLALIGVSAIIPLLQQQSLRAGAIFGAISVVFGIIILSLKPWKKVELYTELGRKLSQLEKKFIALEGTPQDKKTIEIALLTIFEKAPPITIEVIRWMCINTILRNMNEDGLTIKISWFQTFFATWFSWDFRAEKLGQDFSEKRQEYEKTSL